MISDLDIGIATLLFGLALNAFWNRALHIYPPICIYIYIYIHTHTDQYIIPMGYYKNNEEYLSSYLK